MVHHKYTLIATRLCHLEGVAQLLWMLVKVHSTDTNLSSVTTGQLARMWRWKRCLGEVGTAVGCVQGLDEVWKGGWRSISVASLLRQVLLWRMVFYQKR